MGSFSFTLFISLSVHRDPFSYCARFGTQMFPAETVLVDGRVVKSSVCQQKPTHVCAVARISSTETDQKHRAQQNPEMKAQMINKPNCHRKIITDVEGCLLLSEAIALCAFQGQTYCGAISVLISGCFLQKYHFARLINSTHRLCGHSNRGSFCFVFVDPRQRCSLPS